jgi:formamidopyrimidine-DNA glycosylase
MGTNSLDFTWYYCSRWAWYRGQPAVRHRGTTVDSYIDAEGREGGFQNKLQVYARGGEECFRCGGTIRRILLGQRGTYYCPKCQK